jgi:membrane protease YdiL (CAAX protease family)
MRKFFSSLWVMGFATLIAFPLLAWPIFYFQDISLSAVFSVTVRELYSIPTFLSAGIIFGMLMIWMTELRYFEEALSKYTSLLAQFKISRFQVIFLSICAGFGEEVFFRGALQPLFGIFSTAIVFVAMHGYYSYKSVKVNLFAICLTAFIILLGWSAEKYSIWHAIAGHFSYDLILLAYYRKMGD